MRDLAIESTDMSSGSHASGESISPDDPLGKSGNSRRRRKPVSWNSGSKTGRGIGNDAAHHL